MKQDLQALQNYVDEMKSTSSGNEKQVIIEKYLQNKFVAKALIYENSPFIQFNVTSTSISKNPTLSNNSILDFGLFDLLDNLCQRNVTGHNAIGAVNSFINAYPEYKQLILDLIDKDLKTRAGASLINKVKPNHVPEFDVALAQKYEPEFCDFENETWYASRKLDGCRCIVVVNEHGKVTAWSRQGKQFDTLDKVIADIEQLGFVNTVFDGEICIVDEMGNENFSDIMKEIRRKDHTIQNPKYIMFDMLTLDEFNTKTSTRLLHERLYKLYRLSNLYPTLDILKQQIIHNQEDFLDWQNQANAGNWEGFMLRKNHEYEGKRSKNLLKVKKFHDNEYVVKRIETGPFRVITDGIEHEEIVLSNVVIEHKGYEVSVGSGFSLEQRREFYKDPTKIIGKEITVQFFEETTNKQGGISLRFPTCKCIYIFNRDC
jgi:DNA ligase-1